MDDLYLVLAFIMNVIRSVWATLNSGNIIFTIVIGNMFLVAFVSIFKRVKKGMGK